MESHDYYGVTEVFGWLYGVALSLMFWQASDAHFVELRIGRWYFAHVLYLITLFPAVFGLRYHLAFLPPHVVANASYAVDRNTLPKERFYALVVLVLGLIVTMANLGFAIQNTIHLLSFECSAQLWCSQHMWNLILICALAYFMTILVFGHVIYTMIKKITPLFLQHTESVRAAEASAEARKHHN